MTARKQNDDTGAKARHDLQRYDPSDLLYPSKSHFHSFHHQAKVYLNFEAIIGLKHCFSQILNNLVTTRNSLTSTPRGVRYYSPRHRNPIQSTRLTITTGLRCSSWFLGNTGERITKCLLILKKSYWAENEEWSAVSQETGELWE
jgi:hypothetical protein